MKYTETLRKIAVFFQVSLDYLLSNENEASSSELQNELLRVFDKMTPLQKEIYIEQGKAILKITRQHHNTSATS